MNRTVEKLHAILDRFKLREPVPVDVRNYIHLRKKKTAAAVLRHFGDYSMVYGMAMDVFYGARRWGFRLSMKQAKALLAGAAVLIITAALTIFVIIFSDAKIKNDVKNIDSNHRGIVEGLILPDSEGEVQPDVKKEDTVPPEKTMPTSGVRFRLGVENFSGAALEAGEAQRITDMIFSELIRLRGAEKVVKLSGADRRKNANFALLGNVEKLGSAYIITAKIVDIQSGRVTASFDESADTTEDIDAACRRLAAKAAGRVE